VEEARWWSAVIVRGPAAEGGRRGSLLQLDGGRGTADCGGDGKVVGAAGAAVETLCGGGETKKNSRRRGRVSYKRGRRGGARGRRHELAATMRAGGQRHGSAAARGDATWARRCSGTGRLTGGPGVFKIQNKFQI
jgi:hypothetical protein